jgi:hypothetical protein
MASVKVVKPPSANPAQPPLDVAVTITAKIARESGSGTITAGYTFGGKDLPAVLTQADAAIGTSLDVTQPIEKFASANAGKYKLWIKDGDTAVEVDATNVVELKDPAAKPATPAEPPAEVELRDLVWDPNFAANTGWVVGVIVLAVATLCAIAAAKVISSDPSPADVKAFVVYLGALAGFAAIAVGAWIALLELRGRAPKSTADAAELESKGFTKEQIEAATGFVTAWGKLRSSFAVLLAGVALIITIAILAGNDVKPPTTPTTGTTTTTVG